MNEHTINFEFYLTDWRGKLQTTINEDARNELLGISDSAFILFQFFMSKRKEPEFRFTDTETAEEFPCWSLRKIGEVRRRLTKEGWFYQISGRMNDGRNVMSTYLGSGEVARVKKLAEEANKARNKNGE